jgi:hypothetical protein
VRACVCVCVSLREISWRGYGDTKWSDSWGALVERVGEANSISKSGVVESGCVCLPHMVPKSLLASLPDIFLCWRGDLLHSVAWEIICVWEIIWVSLISRSLSRLWRWSMRSGRHSRSVRLAAGSFMMSHNSKSDIHDVSFFYLMMCDLQTIWMEDSSWNPGHLEWPVGVYTWANLSKERLWIIWSALVASSLYLCSLRLI